MSELSPTELRALKLAALGMTGLETAFEANCSYEAIKGHRARALRKLGARNMAHAIALGFRQGLLA